MNIIKVFFKRWNHGNAKRCLMKSFATRNIDSLSIKVVATHHILFIHYQILLVVLFIPHQVFISDIYLWTYSTVWTYFMEMGKFVLGTAKWSKFPRATKALCLIMSLTQKSTGNVIWLSITVISGACEAYGSCKNSCNPGLLSLWPSHVFLKPINGIFRAWKLDGSNINLNILNDTGSLGSAFYNNI